MTCGNVNIDDAKRRESSDLHRTLTRAESAALMPIWTGPSRSTDFKHCSSVLPHRRRYTFDDTHSMDVPNTAGLDWKTARTLGSRYSTYCTAQSRTHRRRSALPTGRTARHRHVPSPRCCVPRTRRFRRLDETPDWTGRPRAGRRAFDGATNNGFAQIAVMPYIACDRGLNLALAVTGHTPASLRPRGISEVTTSRLGGGKYLRVTVLGPNEGASDAH